MIQNEAVAALSIQELPSVVVQLFERARQPLLPGTQGQHGLFVRYLRRKPGRGLAVVYNASPLNSSRGTRSRTPERWVSLTLGEAALEGTQIRFAARQAQEAALDAQPAGVLRVSDLDLVMQAFPADDGLPGLAASCTPARDTDRKSTRLNSSHGYISYAVFCLKKKNRRAGRPPLDI